MYIMLYEYYTVCLFVSTQFCTIFAFVTFKLRIIWNILRVFFYSVEKTKIQLTWGDLKRPTVHSTIPLVFYCLTGRSGPFKPGQHSWALHFILNYYYIAQGFLLHWTIYETAASSSSKNFPWDLQASKDLITPADHFRCCKNRASCSYKAGLGLSFFTLRVSFL